MPINMNTVIYVLVNLDPDINQEQLAKDCCVSVMTIKRLVNIQKPSKEYPWSLDRKIVSSVFQAYKKTYFEDIDAVILGKIRGILETIGADTTRIDQFFTGDFDTFLTHFVLEASSSYSKSRKKGIEKEEAAPNQDAERAALQETDQTVRYCSLEELKREGVSIQMVAGKILHNEQVLFGNRGRKSGDEFSQWSEQMQRYPSRWGFLVVGRNRIIGHFGMTLMTLDDEIRYRSGKIHDSEKTAGRAASPTDNSEVAIELLGLSVIPEYATEKNYNLLWKKFGEKLLEFAKNGIYFRSVYTCLYNSNQELYFQKRGFGPLCVNEQNVKVYFLDLTYNIPKGLAWAFPGLYDAYSNEFGGKIEFGDCPSAEEITIEQAQQIGDLVYTTDRHIYPAIFESRADAKMIIGNLIKLSQDSIFKTDNFFCAFLDGRVIGIVHFFIGAINWTSETLREEAMITGLSLKDTFKKVEEVYFTSYNQQPSEIMSLLNVCVDPLFRSSNFRLGSKLMIAFLERYGSEYEMQLHVLRETPNAIRLYRSVGFVTDGNEYEGFSLDEQKPVCFYMMRKKSK